MNDLAALQQTLTRQRQRERRRWHWLALLTLVIEGPWRKGQA